MFSLVSLPARTLLVAFATYPGRDYLRYLADYLSQLGYRVITKDYPLGRDISRADVRRKLKPLLFAYPAYPDLSKVRIQILAEFDNPEVA